MNRRKFVWVSSAATLAILIPLNSFNDDSILTHPSSLVSIFGKDTVKKIGKLYLKKTHQKNNKKYIKTLLLNSFKNEISFKSSLNYFEIKNLLNQKIKKDFEINRVIELNGWILSETEAQQCALMYLTNS